MHALRPGDKLLKRVWNAVSTFCTTVRRRRLPAVTQRNSRRRRLQADTRGAGGRTRERDRLSRKHAATSSVNRPASDIDVRTGCPYSLTDRRVGGGACLRSRWTDRRISSAEESFACACAVRAHRIGIIIHRRHRNQSKDAPARYTVLEDDDGRSSLITTRGCEVSA